MTNADRIRAMTDEELAKLIAYEGCPEGCPLDGKSCWYTQNYDNCHSCWLDWLKQEVTDEQ